MKTTVNLSAALLQAARELTAHRADAKRHASARTRLTELLESGRACALPWPWVHELLAIVTHPRI